MFDNPRDAAASLCKAARIGPVLFDYALTALRRHRPGLVGAELSAALRMLLQNQEFRRRMGDAARATVLQFHTLEHQAKQLAQLYRECVR